MSRFTSSELAKITCQAKPRSAIFWLPLDGQIGRKEGTAIMDQMKTKMYCFILLCTASNILDWTKTACQTCVLMFAFHLRHVWCSRNVV